MNSLLPIAASALAIFATSSFTPRPVSVAAPRSALSSATLPLDACGALGLVQEVERMFYQQELIIRNQLYLNRMLWNGEFCSDNLEHWNSLSDDNELLSRRVVDDANFFYINILDGTSSGFDVVLPPEFGGAFLLPAIDATHEFLGIISAFGITTLAELPASNLLLLSALEQHAAWGEEILEYKTRLGAPCSAISGE